MAKRKPKSKKDVVDDAVVSAVKSGLAPPFPSPPTRLPTHVFYITRDEQTKAVMNFSAVYSAKHFLDAVIGKRKYKWKNDFTIVLPDGTEIKCEPNLEEVVEHKFTKLEQQWTLPDPYPSIVHMIVTGKYKKLEAFDYKEDEGEPTGKRSKKTTTDDEAAKKKRQPPPRKELPKGYVGLAEICKSMNIEPREARQVLRKKEQKSDLGWAWPKDKVERIKQLLKRELNA